MIYVYAATFLAGAISAGAGIYQVQEWRYASKEKDRVEQQLENERHATKAALANQGRIVAAQNQAQARTRALRLDADGARTALVRLHDATDAAMRDAAVSHAACIERAATFSDVLKASTDEYRGLAETCDRHVSDIKTLIAAQPRSDN